MLNVSTANYNAVKNDKLLFLVITTMAFSTAHTSVKPSQCPLILVHTDKYKIHALFHKELTKSSKIYVKESEKKIPDPHIKSVISILVQDPSSIHDSWSFHSSFYGIPLTSQPANQLTNTRG